MQVNIIFVKNFQNQVLYCTKIIISDKFVRNKGEEEDLSVTLTSPCMVLPIALDIREPVQLLTSIAILTTLKAIVCYL